MLWFYGELPVLLLGRRCRAGDFFGMSELCLEMCEPVIPTSLFFLKALRIMNRQLVERVPEFQGPRYVIQPCVIVDLGYDKGLVDVSWTFLSISIASSFQAFIYPGEQCNYGRSK